MPWPDYLRKPTGPYADLIIKAKGLGEGLRQEIEQSELAGCTSCGAIFNPSSQDVEYLGEDDDEDDYRELDFALCPYCGVDSLIGSARGIPITEGFIAAATDYWTATADDPRQRSSGKTSVFDWVTGSVRSIMCRIGKHQGRWTPVTGSCLYERACDHCGMITTKKIHDFIWKYEAPSRTELALLDKPDSRYPGTRVRVSPDTKSAWLKKPNCRQRGICECGDIEKIEYRHKWSDWKEIASQPQEGRTCQRCSVEERKYSPFNGSPDEKLH